MSDHQANTKTMWYIIGAAFLASASFIGLVVSTAGDDSRAPATPEPVAARQPVVTPRLASPAKPAPMPAEVPLKPESAANPPSLVDDVATAYSRIYFVAEDGNFVSRPMPGVIEPGYEMFAVYPLAIQADKVLADFAEKHKNRVRAVLVWKTPRNRNEAAGIVRTFLEFENWAAINRRPTPLERLLNAGP